MPRLWPDLDRWIAEGKMTEPSIMKLIDARVQRGVDGDFYASEQKVLKEVFDSASTQHGDKSGILTEAAFISLLTTKERLPSSPEGVDAGKIIYASLKYFSTLPLPRYPDGNIEPEGLDFNQLTRALMWAFPDRHNHFIIFGDQCSDHTPTDQLRFIFQSLALPTSEPPDEGERTLEVERQSDVILENAMDVLYSTQWILVANESIAYVDREKFRPLAKQLMTEYQVAPFSSLAIPRKRFEALVKALLVLQWSTPEDLPDLSEFSSAASCLCAAFLREGESDDFITWPMFERGVRVVAPYILDSYYNLLARLFLGKEWLSCVGTDSESEPFLAPPNILTIPIVSQLFTFLAMSMWVDRLKCFNHYTSSNLPTSTELINAIRSVPDQVIMLLSGITLSGETVTFGLYSCEKTVDEFSIKQNIVPDMNGHERCSIFQLAPVHDIFRGVVGKPGWTFNNENVTFGKDNGVVMILKDHLRKGVVKHQVSGGDKTIYTYEPNWIRGDWTVEFDITEIAIWSEPLE